MVYCEIRDGVGNQMFQYATGLALARRLGTTLRLETRYHKKPGARPFRLRQLSIRARRATVAEEIVVRRWSDPKLALATGWLRKAAPGLALTILSDPHTRFDDRLLSVRGHVYLTGHWQSELYFREIAGEIRQEFAFPDAPDEKNRAVIDEMRACNAVALHVRRGDYVTNPSYNQAIGTCSLDYYRAAVSYLQSRVTEPHFFVFSDDPAWTREHIRLGGSATYVSHNTLVNDLEDMRLMSHCRHFIVANSSFSWWGAWLSAHPDKIVVAPQTWHAGYATPHTVPEHWVRL